MPCRTASSGLASYAAAIYFDAHIKKLVRQFGNCQGLARDHLPGFCAGKYSSQVRPLIVTARRNKRIMRSAGCSCLAASGAIFKFFAHHYFSLTMAAQKEGCAAFLGEMRMIVPNINF